MYKKILLFAAVTLLTALTWQFGNGINEKIKTQVIQIVEEDAINDEALTLNERYSYKLIDQGEKIIYLETGEEKDITITLKNTGKSNWYLVDGASGQLVLSTYMPRSHESVFASKGMFSEWIDPSKIKIEDKDGKAIIEPQDTVTFSFEISAPEFAGVYKETFLPLVTNKKWINDSIISYDFVVEGDYSKSYKAERVDEKEEVFSTNKEKQIKLELKNTGNVTWYNTSPFPLTLTSSDKTINAIMVETRVAPNDTGTFLFDLTSGNDPETYELPLYLTITDLFKIEKNPVNLTIIVTNKRVALTFDDGYGDIGAFIDVLNEQGVRATFFMLGEVAQGQPENMKRIVNEGHLLANHSYNHPDFRTLSDSQIIWHLNETRTIMSEITGYDVYPYFRYPYGAKTAHTDAVLASQGWKWFHWTNGTGDYKHHENSAAGRQQVYFYATLNPPDQAVILMHIISKSTLAVIPDIVKWYRDHGYAFVTVDELEY